MKKWLIAVCIMVAGFVQAAPGKPRVYVSHFENVLGTSLEVKLVASSDLAADRAENAALDEIARLNQVLSGYDPASEFSRWAATHNQPVKISRELFEVLSLFDAWQTRSHGALSASAEAIGRVWKQAAARQQLPDAAALQSAVQVAGQRQWVLDAASGTAIHTGAAPLVLNSFAKSYIIHHAAEVAMATEGVKGVAVNIGGDIVLKGEFSEPVMITNPFASAENDAPLAGIRVSNKAIATSGNYRRGVQIGDAWYSHIVDPRTGLPASHIISATVVAPEATDAGALATAFNLMSPAEIKELTTAMPGVEYLVVTKEGEQITSPGWESIALPVREASPAEKTADWNAGYEVAVNFEIALIEGTRVRRPFLAVWIEDEKGTPVRNINVWYNRERWLPDLKLWFRNYGKAFNAEGSTLKAAVSSATRSPGKYTVKWDGVNDKGETVKPGKYTVVIEAVREHGSYQLMKQEIEIKKKPSAKTYNLPGNVEIASASVELRKRASN